MLKRLRKHQLAATPPTLRQADVLAKAAGTGALIEDGVEVSEVSFDGGSTSGVPVYRKEVVMQAA